MKIQRGDCVRTFIKVATIRQKELAIKFYEKRGFKLAPYQSWRISNKGSYYVFPNIKQNWIVLTSSSAAIARLKEIDLFRRNRLKFPREMLVSYTGKKWIKETVHGKVFIHGEPFYVIYPSMPNGSEKVFCWKYAKEIE